MSQLLDFGLLFKSAESQQYEHTYNGYMKILEYLSTAPIDFTCENVPKCWLPFLRYLGHSVVSTKQFGSEDLIDFQEAYEHASDKRRIVEIASACRPELVDSLYKYDTYWSTFGRRPTAGKASNFYVTCNGSFFRPEVQAYLEGFRNFYAPPTDAKIAVLVPCAADKPYPSPMHKAVLQRLQDSQAHVLVTTGVLGLIPLEYQHEAPVYDSGLPNKERVEHTVRWYFTKFAKQYSAIIVYSDFYAEAIYKGIKETNLAYNTKYIFGHYTRDTYENLMKPENLDALEVAYKELL